MKCRIALGGISQYTGVHSRLYPDQFMQYIVIKPGSRGEVMSFVSQCNTRRRVGIIDIKHMKELSRNMGHT